MAQNARTVRRDTQEMINRYVEEQDRQINAIKSDYQNQADKLRREHTKQVNDLQNQLQDLRKKYLEAINSIQTQLAEDLAAQEKRLLEEIDRIEREYSNQFQQLKKEFEANLKQMYEDIDRRIIEVQDLIDQSQQDERELAAETVANAKDLLEEASSNQNVLQFERNALNNILTPMVNDCILRYEKNDYIGSSGKAMLAEVECRRLCQEADADRREWDERMQSVHDRCQKLLKQLENMDRPAILNMTGADWKGNLRNWVELPGNTLQDVFHNIENNINTVNTNLNNIEIGNRAGLVNIEMEIIRLNLQESLTDLQSRIIHQIRAYLIMIELLDCLRSADEAWSGDMTVDRAGLTGNMTLENDENKDKMIAETFVDQTALGYGKVKLVLFISYHGTRWNNILALNLTRVINAMKQRVLEGEADNLMEDLDSAFFDNEGYPARRLDYSEMPYYIPGLIYEDQYQHEINDQKHPPVDVDKFRESCGSLR